MRCAGSRNLSYLVLAVAKAALAARLGSSSVSGTTALSKGVLTSSSTLSR